MNTIDRLLKGCGLTASAMILFAGTISAQPTPLARMTEQLSLSDDQVETIQTTVADVDGNPSWAMAATLQEVLSADQKERLFEEAGRAQTYMRGVHDGARMGRGSAARRGSAAGRGVRPDRQRMRQRALGSLDLSDEQRASIRELNQTHREALESLSGDRDERRDRAAELGQAHRDAVAEVLTDDQRTRLAEMQEMREERSMQRGDRRGSQRGVRGNRPGMRGGQQAVRGRRGARAQGVSPGDRAGRNSENMAQALDLTDEQLETVRIHRALTALRAGAVANRAARRP